MKNNRFAIPLAVLLLGCGYLIGRANPAPAPSPKDLPSERVTGIGGTFFKARDPKRMVAWYRENLGIDAKNGQADFTWREKENSDHYGRTVWAVFPTNSPYFHKSTASFMINYRVPNLDRMIAQLKDKGVTAEKVETYDFGRFSWVTDPEGNRIELWEPREK
jgi:predicted enzyme related to lactoylglutathione lyase